MRDLEQLVERHGHLAGQFAAMLRTGASETPIPHLEWNVGQLGKHILGGLRAYRAAALESTEVWTDFETGSEQNARMLEAVPEQGTDAIAAVIPGAARDLHDAWRSRGNDLITWSGGLKMDTKTAAGVLISDLLIHGWDLSRALKRPWTIDRSDALDAIEASLPLASNFVAHEAAAFTGTYEIRFRGNGRRVLAFDRGSLTIGEDPDARVDCRLSADPRAFLLASYGRVPVLRTAVTGGIVAFGKKPWLGFKFKSLLRNI